MKIKIPKTFEKTNPRWTKKIRNRETVQELGYICEVDGKILDIRHFNCCIVGEALNLFEKGSMYGLTEEQLITIHNGCGECLKFSRIFDSVIADRDMKRFEKKLKEFSNHLEQKHKELIK